VRHNEIRRLSDGVVLARAYALWVFVDLATGKPVRVPGDFIESFRPNVAE
jgi:acyl-CoA thioesterase FadM